MLSIVASSLLVFTLAGASLAAAVPVAQVGSFDTLFSLTSGATLAGQTIEDEEVLLQRESQPARLAWPGETLSALAGDPGQSGLNHVFGDLDAIHDPGLGGPGGEFMFSITSDEVGYLDGDVIGATDGGYELVIPESAFMAVAGVDDGNLDIDAIHFYADGSLLFSFAENESSNLLSGDTAGLLADGDVLLWPAGATVAQLVFTEGQIDAMVSNALGTNVTTGDTKGLAVDPSSGDILFTVQSPSAHDGSVFSSAMGGMLVPGHDEASLGFAGAVELDGLTVALTTWPTLEASDPKPQGGSTLSVSVTGEQPGAAYVVLMSQSLDVVWSWLPGWGGVTLTQDNTFYITLSQLPSLTVVADGLGRAVLPLAVPVGLPAVDIYLQAFDLGNPHVSTNPLVVELDQ